MIKGMISVVIPVYNAEKYIRNAIRSVLEQTYTNFEIIAVNDGSTDRSLDILKQFDDSRIRIISKENTGVSDTRNIAIQAAQGEYVCFLDADDAQAPQYMQRMYETAEEKQADMVACSYKTFRGAPAFDGEKADAISVQSVRLLIQQSVLTSVGTKLIRLSALRSRNIQFDQNMTFGEDLFFCWKAFLASDNVWFIDEKLYAYRIAANSAISRFHPDLYEKYKAGFEELKEFSIENGKTDCTEMDLYFTTRIRSFIMMTVREKSGIFAKMKRLKSILSDVTIERVLCEWTGLNEVINKTEVSFYKKCRAKNTLWLLITGYKREAEMRLKNKVGKIIWRKVDYKNL